MESEFEPNLRSAQIIAGLLFLAPVVFWIVGWWILRQGNGAPTGASLAPDDAIVLLIGIALATLSASVLFRRSAIPSVDTDERIGRRSEAPRALADLHRNLTFAWVSVEAPALLSGLFFVRHGTTDFVLVGAVVLVIGAYLTFPRRAWYRPFEDLVRRA